MALYESFCAFSAVCSSSGLIFSVDILVNLCKCIDKSNLSVTLHSVWEPFLYGDTIMELAIYVDKSPLVSSIAVFSLEMITSHTSAPV